MLCLCCNLPEQALSTTSPRSMPGMPSALMAIAALLWRAAAERHVAGVLEVWAEPRTGALPVFMTQTTSYTLYRHAVSRLANLGLLWRRTCAGHPVAFHLQAMKKWHSGRWGVVHRNNMTYTSYYLTSRAYGLSIIC